MKGILSKLYIKDQEMKKYSIIKKLYVYKPWKQSYKSTQMPSTFFSRVFGHTYEQILQHTNMNSVHF